MLDILSGFGVFHGSSLTRNFRRTWRKEPPRRQSLPQPPGANANAPFSVAPVLQREPNECEELSDTAANSETSCPLTYSSTVWTELGGGERACRAPDLARLRQERASPSPVTARRLPAVLPFRFILQEKLDSGQINQYGGGLTTGSSLCSPTAVRPPQELSINSALIKNSSCYLRLCCGFIFFFSSLLLFSARSGETAWKLSHGWREGGKRG